MNSSSESETEFAILMSACLVSSSSSSHGLQVYVIMIMIIDLCHCSSTCRDLTMTKKNIGYSKHHIGTREYESTWYTRRASRACAFYSLLTLRDNYPSQSTKRKSLHSHWRVMWLIGRAESLFYDLSKGVKADALFGINTVVVVFPAP